MIIFFGFGLWFWGLVILELCLLTWFVEEEWPGPSIASLLIFLVLLWWLADIPIWEWIKNNPGKLVIYCIYYILIGIAWSMGKYFFILKKLRKAVKEYKKVWETSGPETRKQYKSFEKFFEQRCCDPQFKTTSKKLTFWATFWPTSMIWTILNDPIKKLFKFLIDDVFTGIYRKMHQKMVGDLLKE